MLCAILNLFKMTGLLTVLHPTLCTKTKNPLIFITLKKFLGNRAKNESA